MYVYISQVFSHLASIKALVSDMEALKDHVCRNGHLLEVIIVKSVGRANVEGRSEL
jgi:hypothetical protein